MESFRQFTEGFFSNMFGGGNSVPKEIQSVAETAQGIESALDNMQMKEKGYVLGTPDQMPPETARGMTTDSPDSWAFLAYSLKGDGDANYQSAMMLYRSFQQMLQSWKKFLNAFNQKYNMQVGNNQNESTIPSSLNTSNWRPATRVNTSLNNRITYQMIGTLNEKVRKLQFAVSSANNVEQNLKNDPQMASLWRNFLNYYEIFNQGVTKNLPIIARSLKSTAVAGYYDQFNKRA